MPMGQFKDWDACIAHYKGKGRSAESAAKLCGAIKSKTESLEKWAKQVTSTPLSGKKKK